MKSSANAVKVLLFSVGLTGCGVFGEREPIPFVDVPDAEYLHVQESKTLVFRDSVAWVTFWHEHMRAYRDNRPIPPVDINFERSTAVGLFWGGGIFGGCFQYVNAVESVDNSDGSIVVRVGSLPDLGPCRAVQHPLQIVVFEEPDARVRFVGNVPGNK